MVFLIKLLPCHESFHIPRFSNVGGHVEPYRFVVSNGLVK